MVGENYPSHESSKDRWMQELTAFLSESNANGWAAGAEKQKNLLTGEKKLVYEHGDWRYEDTYSGYYTAPGETKVFHKGRHVWGMNYAGQGQNPEHYDKVKETFEFLRAALQVFDSELPLRGPSEFRDQSGRWQYTFSIDGDLLNGAWVEMVGRLEPGIGYRQYFSQTGTCGIIIDKDADYNPIFPWDHEKSPTPKQ